jgi:hypothetical protein
MAGQTREALRVLGGTPRVLRLVWDAHPGYAVLLLAIGLAQGLVPLAELWIFKQLVDAVAAAVPPPGAGGPRWRTREGRCAPSALSAGCSRCRG